MGEVDIEDILLAAIVSVLVGRRLGYCLFYREAGVLPREPARHHPEVWDGGADSTAGRSASRWASPGSRVKKKRPFLQVADFLVPAAPIGLATGRFGNFINGELWGREAPPTCREHDLPHRRRRPPPPLAYTGCCSRASCSSCCSGSYARKPRFRGQVAGFFVANGVFRFIAEFWREPDANLGLLGMGLSMGQWLSRPHDPRGPGLLDLRATPP